MHEQGEGNAWGMAIDLNTCIGCGACVVACQAENNIPVVGREQVLASREMHWIRIDRYFEGEDTTQPQDRFSAGALHALRESPVRGRLPGRGDDAQRRGLNEMTYNRCVGTRYCSNNCPYKVRRFNFLHYADETSPALKLMQNPDVTVRSRGVMEKCTYCVQRINAARINAEIENRPVGGDEVVTACQAACPTRGDRVRQSERPQERGRQGQGQPAQLRAPGRAQHPAAHHLSGQAPQPQPRDRGRPRDDSHRS